MRSLQFQHVVVRALLALLVIPAALLHAAGPTPNAVPVPGKEAPMPDAASPLRYGFRHDAMNWIIQSPSLDAAHLRAEFGLAPQPNDRNLIDAEIDKLLAGQRPDGLIPNPKSDDALYDTGNVVLKALLLGCPADRPAIQQAAAGMLAELKRRQAAGTNEKKLMVYIAALCQAGYANDPAVQRAVADGMAELHAYDAANAFGPGVARTPNQRIMRLWYCRNALPPADVNAELDRWMHWMDAGLDDTGCGSKVGLFLLWDVLDIMGNIDHPIAARRARQLVPILERMQQPDGSFGSRWNYLAAHLLLKYKLLEAVRDRPPLPPDWKVVRDIPITIQRPFSLAWDGTRLWVQDRHTHAAYALDRADGHQLAEITLPGTPGKGVLGAGPGCLYLAVGEDERMLYKINPANGETLWQKPFHPRWVLGVAELGGRIELADYDDGHMHETSATDPAPADNWTQWRAAAGMPNFITTAGDDALWISDGLCPLLIKSTRDGRLLDWGEKPFDWGGIAYDGTDLWALDPGGKRLCVIVKASHSDQRSTP